MLVAAKLTHLEDVPGINADPKLGPLQDNGGPSHADSLKLNADGSFDYKPGADYNGEDFFTYKVRSPQSQVAPGARP